MSRWLHPWPCVHAVQCRTPEPPRRIECGNRFDHVRAERPGGIEFRGVLRVLSLRSPWSE